MCQPLYTTCKPFIKNDLHKFQINLMCHYGRMAPADAGILTPHGNTDTAVKSRHWITRLPITFCLFSVNWAAIPDETTHGLPRTACLYSEGGV